MSEQQFLLDTGPLVAFLNPREEHHRWAVNVFQRLDALFITCEPVLTEAFHLLAPRRMDRTVSLISANQA